MTPIDKMKRVTVTVREANKVIAAHMSNITNSDRMSLLPEDVVRNELRKAIKDLESTLHALRKMA